MASKVSPCVSNWPTMEMMSKFETTLSWTACAWGATVGFLLLLSEIQAADRSTFFLAFALVITAGFIAFAGTRLFIHGSRERRVLYRVSFLLTVIICVAGGVGGFIFFSVSLVLLAILAFRPLAALA
jgi:hypothetical protein